MVISLRDIQDEVGDWLKHNFGEVALEDQALVIAEEVGELCHAVLKSKQGIRRNEDHEAGMRDAVADIVIATAAFCAVKGIDLEDLVGKTWAKVRERDWTAERHE